MPTDNDVTTVRLPHTGLRVPDRSLTLTAFKSMQTHDGVAFNANLRHNKKRVGVVENHGTGGMTFFYADNPKVFCEKHLDEYAARCRTEEGNKLDSENLLDTLVEEDQTQRSIDRLGRQGKTYLRLFDATYGAPYGSDSASCRMPANDNQWKTLARQLQGSTDMQAGPNQWWQGWTGDQWIDLTARPASVDPKLYG